MLTIGAVTLPYYVIINIAEALFMLGFFLYITGRIRGRGSEVEKQAR